MLPAKFYAERAKGKKQAQWMVREMKVGTPDSISVETWLGGFRHLFPDQRSEQTAFDQMQRLQPFRRAYGSRKVSSITAIEAQAWTLKHPAQVRLLREAWTVAVRMQVAPLNVWHGVIKPQRTKPKPCAPTDVELDMILLRAREQASPEFVNLIEVAAYTGARQGGLMILRRNSVDLEARRMTLKEKGGKVRTVVLPTPAVDALRCQIGKIRKQDPNRLAGTGNPRLWERAWGNLWLARYGEPLRSEDVQAAWRKVRGDFPHGFHALRHYATTWMAREGVDPLDIAVQLGHTDREGRPYADVVRRVYDHPSQEPALARLAEKLS